MIVDERVRTPIKAFNRISFCLDVERAAVWIGTYSSLSPQTIRRNKNNQDLGAWFESKRCNPFYPSGLLMSEWINDNTTADSIEEDGSRAYYWHIEQLLDQLLVNCIILLSHFFDIQPKFSSILRCFLSSIKITYNHNSPTAVESRGSFHQVSEHRAASWCQIVHDPLKTRGRSTVAAST